MSQIVVRCAELGLVIPEIATPIANYVGFTISGRHIHVSGQLPMVNGKIAVIGKVGGDLSIEEGYEAARLCAINVLAQLKAACETDLERISRIVRLTGYVNCTPDFREVPKCINGASDLMVAVLGDLGRHTRAAVGVATLPGGAAVEIDAIAELK